MGSTVDFPAPARGQGVTADARVVRTGATGLCLCEVRAAVDDGTRVALALVTCQLSGRKQRQLGWPTSAG